MPHFRLPSLGEWQHHKIKGKINALASWQAKQSRLLAAWFGWHVSCSQESLMRDIHELMRLLGEEGHCWTHAKLWAASQFLLS
jgi:hypothetical protein